MESDERRSYVLRVVESVGLFMATFTVAWWLFTALSWTSMDLPTTLGAAVINGTLIGVWDCHEMHKTRKRLEAFERRRKELGL